MGVIELDRGKNDRLGKIVKELWSFIEESGVVLVAFQDEVLSLPQSKAAAKIFRNAAHQKRRIFAGRLKNPGKHPGCRGLAVASRDANRPARAQQEIATRVG